MNGPVELNPFGHVAIGVTGAGVFSYGMPGTAPGSSVEDYVASHIDRRSTTMYVIPTTPEQDAAALRYLTAEMRTPCNAVTHNCAVVCNGALDAAGVGAGEFRPYVAQAFAGTFCLPVSSALRGASSATQTLEIPQFAAGIVPLDPALHQFDPATSK